MVNDWEYGITSNICFRNCRMDHIHDDRLTLVCCYNGGTLYSLKKPIKQTAGKNWRGDKQDNPPVLFVKNTWYAQ